MMPAKTPSGPAERARLIPVAGIGTHKEAERRAASALLAVLTVARDLSRDLLTPLGASKAGKAVVEAYTEVRYDLGGGDRTSRRTHPCQLWQDRVDGVGRSEDGQCATRCWPGQSVLGRGSGSRIRSCAHDLE